MILAAAFVVGCASAHSDAGGEGPEPEPAVAAGPESPTSSRPDPPPPTDETLAPEARVEGPTFAPLFAAEDTAALACETREDCVLSAYDDGHCIAPYGFCNPRFAYNSRAAAELKSFIEASDGPCGPPTISQRCKDSERGGFIVDCVESRCTATRVER